MEDQVLDSFFSPSRLLGSLAARRRRALAMLTLGGAAVLLLCATGVTWAAPQQQQRQRLEGKTPPDFVAQTLDGKQVRLSAFKGKALIVDFWATWCPPCRQEMPVLNEFHKQFASQGLVVLCVAVNRQLETVRKFIQDHGYSMRVGWLDPSKESSVQIFRAYGITAIPRTLYISKDFVVIHDDIGAHPKEKMLSAVQDLGIETQPEEKE